MKTKAISLLGAFALCFSTYLFAESPSAPAGAEAPAEAPASTDSAGSEPVTCISKEDAEMLTKEGAAFPMIPNPDKESKEEMIPAPICEDLEKEGGEAAGDTADADKAAADATADKDAAEAKPAEAGDKPE